MTYFEFYGIPETLNPDPKQLRQRYFELSKQYHPDFHANESQARQAEILELSTLNTRAYQTLSHFDKLVQYVLNLHGLLSETTPGALPQDFLMEMMDLNEEIMDMQAKPTAAALQKVEGQVAELQKTLQQNLQPVVEQYEQAAENEKAAMLQKLKDYYLKSRYLLRIRESLGKIAAPNA